MANLTEKLLKLKQLREEISDKKNRLEGKLDADQKALRKLESELEEEGIQPAELEKEIEKLETKLTQEYERLEKELDEISEKVTDIEAQCS